MYACGRVCMCAGGRNVEEMCEGRGCACVQEEGMWRKCVRGGGVHVCGKST